VSTLAVAEGDGAAQIGWGDDTQSYYYDLDWSGVPKLAAQMACKLLGGKPLNSGLYKVILTAEVTRELLQFLGQAMTAEAVGRGQSFFKRDHLEQKLLSTELNIVDDPHARKRVGSCYWDAEGVPTQKLQLVQSGVLKAFSHTLKSAKRWGEVSTGHAVRSEATDIPQPGFHNLVLEPGRKDFIDLLRDAQNGLVVHSVMGLHTANAITGDFSLGAAGTVIEGGEERRAFGNVALSGNIKSLLASVVGVGRDLRWGDGVAAPSILCENVNVAGTSAP
jgi:PmbA protein